MSYRQERDRSSLPPYTISDLFQGENLDIIAALLLITGKLKVNSVEIYRGEPAVLVTLVGEYKRAGSQGSEHQGSVLEENEGLSMDDIVEAVCRRLQE